jgi:uncharacterized surface protein with fasciclin (FAS1) repeats
MIHALASLPSDSAHASGVREILTAPRRDLLDALHASGRFRTLLRLAVAAELTEDLESGGPYTIFAPTDAAFAALGDELGALFLPHHAERLCDRLEYHLVRGRVDLGEALEVGALRSVHGAEIHLRQDEEGIRVDGARVIGAPLTCSNGVVVIVDRVLRPASPEVLTVKPLTPLARTKPRGAAPIRSAGRLAQAGSLRSP